MAGEQDLETLLKTMQPQLNEGNYVFCHIKNIKSVPIEKTLLIFKEPEGSTVIIKKELADVLQLPYSFVASWITLKVHSSLEAVGFTAAFSSALSQQGISCNVVATFYHDHIFVNKKDQEKAMAILQSFSNK